MNKGIPVVESTGPNDNKIFSRARNFFSAQFIRWINDFVDFFEVGVYTPTEVSFPVNVASITYKRLNYTRIGNRVYVDGSIDIAATSIGDYFAFIDLPIKTTLSSLDDINGAGADRATGNNGTIAIYAYTSSPAGALIQGYATRTTLTPKNIHFSYTIK